MPIWELICHFEQKYMPIGKNPKATKVGDGPENWHTFLLKVAY